MSSGRRCRTCCPLKTATEPAGNCSCAMLPRTRRFRRPSSKAPKASSSPKRATRAIASVAGSSWNRSVCSAPARGCYSGRQNNAISRGRPPVTRIVPATRRRILQAAAASSVVVLAKAPAFAQAQPKKLVFAHVTASPESSAVAFEAMAKEVTERSKGELAMEFHGGTLLTKELEIINAVKSGNIAMGDPGGAAATVFPEMGVFLVPYLVASYDQAYRMIDGADLPIVNILALKAYEVSKYCSMTYHNYGPTAAVINLDLWNGLSDAQRKLLQETSRTAQEKVRQLTESVDNFNKAKELLEPKGMTVNKADVEAFRRVAQDKVWPAYKQQFPEMWEEIVATKV